MFLLFFFLMKMYVCSIRKAFLQDYVHQYSKKDYFEESENSVFKIRKVTINYALEKAKQNKSTKLRLCRKPQVFLLLRPSMCILLIQVFLQWTNDTVPPRTGSSCDSKSVVVLKLLPLEDTEMYCSCCYLSVLLKHKRTMKMLYFLHFPISKQIIFSESSYFKKAHKQKGFRSTQ